MMFIKNNKYYFMWGEGGWTGPIILLPMLWPIRHSDLFERVGKILQQSPAIATGAGHHSIIHNPQKDLWYIVYHRRPLGQTEVNHRVTCIEQLFFDENGFIKPVKPTNEGVMRQSLK